MKSCRFVAAFCIAIAAAACAPPPAWAQQTDDASIQDDALKVYAVEIVKTRLMQRSTGYAIYLGRGAVITAAHVVGRWHFLDDLQVSIAGQELPAKIVKEGSVETTDLTVLSVDEALLPAGLRLRRNPVCREPLRVGQAVVVVTSDGTARSRIISPQSVLPEYRTRFSSLISNVALGSSGSGVFDANKRCLLGIISRRISRSDIRAGDRHTSPQAKYFVPPSTMADFIPPEYRF